MTEVIGIIKGITMEDEYLVYFYTTKSKSGKPLRTFAIEKSKDYKNNKDYFVAHRGTYSECEAFTKGYSSRIMYELFMNLIQADDVYAI